MICRDDASFKPADILVRQILKEEYEQAFHEMSPYKAFAQRVAEHKIILWDTIAQLRKKKAKVFGYGASTKGNVILQWCGFSKKELPVIADVNPDKFGHLTPGTWIPIVSEDYAKKERPDYFLVLPWHFRQNFLFRERKFLKRGGKMIFPLPEIEMVGV